ncbi:hypothetical protein L6452_35617 [Arctium lappa]|uniref:Uncharacterized protein n=1 Tax=Arctium lappa TaxID=4217 RepID=A0ACB8Y6A8_ARCLA|nr:hypothetical protein L6452_35617 [Arctium lappa]
MNQDPKQFYLRQLDRLDSTIPSTNVTCKATVGIMWLFTRSQNRCTTFNAYKVQIKPEDHQISNINE